MFKIGIKNAMLLTGAGFTKNFGGFLANEMWAYIFNNPLVQTSAILREKLVDDQDFESVYSTVIDDTKILEEDRKRLTDSVLHAYHSMDRAIIRSRGAGAEPHIYSVMSFLNMFGGNSSERGLIFSLNQDLWLERQYQCNCPGVPEFSPLLVDQHQDELKQGQFVTLPPGPPEDKARQDIESRAGFIYVKLHGSYGWRSEERPNQLVIGTKKEELIGSHPLLRWYFDLLNWAISRRDQKLVIIGYGFRDSHVNRILVDGVLNHGLQLYIISPTSFDQLRQQMTFGQYYAIEMFKGLRRYYPCTLKEMFPKDGNPSIHAENLRQALTS